MQRQEAQDLTNQLLREFKLVQRGWTLKWLRSKHQLGVCRHWDKTIGLSKTFVELNDRAAVEDVIRHEIAHALVGPNVASHGREWKEMCAVTGAVPRCNQPDVVSAPYRYRGHCRGCDEVIVERRTLRRETRYATWRHNGSCGHTGRVRWVDTRQEVTA